MSNQILTCMHECDMQQVDSMDENTIATKVGTYNLHISTLDFTLENFEGTLTKYKAMLEDA